MQTTDGYYKDYVLPTVPGPDAMSLAQVQSDETVNIMNWVTGMMDNHSAKFYIEFKADLSIMHLTVPRSWPEQPQRFPQVNLGTSDELPLSEMAIEDQEGKRVEELRVVTRTSPDFQYFLGKEMERERLAVKRPPTEIPEMLRPPPKAPPAPQQPVPPKPVMPKQTPPVGQPVKAEARPAPKAPPPVPLPPAPAAGSAQNPWQDMNAGKGAWKCDFGKGAGKCGGKGPRDRSLNLSLHEIPVTFPDWDATNQSGCIIAQALYYSMGRK